MGNLTECKVLFLNWIWNCWFNSSLLKTSWIIFVNFKTSGCLGGNIFSGIWVFPWALQCCLRLTSACLSFRHCQGLAVAGQRYCGFSAASSHFSCHPVRSHCAVLWKETYFCYLLTRPGFFSWPYFWFACDSGKATYFLLSLICTTRKIGTVILS